MSADGTVLRQQRDLGQVIESAINLYLQNFWPLFKIAAVLIPFGLVFGVLSRTIDVTVDDPNDEEAVRDFLITGVAVLFPVLLLQSFAQWMAYCGIFAAIADIDAGQPPDFIRAYGVVLGRFWRLVGAALRVFVVVFLLWISVIGIPFAIYFGVRWFFFNQAVILDRTSARAALSYSADAVEGNWWRTLGIAIVIGMVATVPAQIVTLPFTFAPTFISATVGATVTAAFLPFAAIALTLLYLDLKTRKESYVTASPA